MTPEQKERYSRQLSLSEIGEAGQQRLLDGSVLVIGAGGLGSPAILYLAAAGVGTIGIADGDRVDLSNLQRQIIHSTPRLGQYKALSAMHTAQEINPGVKFSAVTEFLTPATIGEAIKDYDFIIDATDSLEGKFFINDACVAARKPYSHGAIYRWQGQLMTVLPGTATLRDLFDEMPPSSGHPAGPMGPLPGVIGTLQAAETIKYLTGSVDLLTDALLTYDMLKAEFKRIRVK